MPTVPKRTIHFLNQSLTDSVKLKKQRLKGLHQQRLHLAERRSVSLLSRGHRRPLARCPRVVVCMLQTARAIKLNQLSHKVRLVRYRHRCHRVRAFLVRSWDGSDASLPMRQEPNKAAQCRAQPVQASPCQRFRVHQAWRLNRVKHAASRASVVDEIGVSVARAGSRRAQ